MKIPKIFHHVWPGDDEFRPQFHRFRESWLRHHPDWTMLFWRKRDPADRPVAHDGVRALLEDKRYTVVVKADVLRLWALFEYGGVYVDADFECLKSFEPLRDPVGGFFCGKEDDRYCCPSLIGATPEHPLVWDLLVEALARVEREPIDRCNKKPNEITGPYLLTELVERHGGVKVYPRGVFYPVSIWDARTKAGKATPGAYAKHYFNGWADTKNGWVHRPTFG